MAVKHGAAIYPSTLVLISKKSNTKMAPPIYRGFKEEKLILLYK